jgi:hypothetical protein
MGIQLLADSAELPQVSTTISRWFASSANQLQEIYAGSQVSRLMQPRAPYSANNGEAWCGRRDSNPHDVAIEGF